MIFRIGNIALYRNQYLCRIEDNDHSRIPYLVQFLGNDRPDHAYAVRNMWCVWCRPEDLSLWRCCKDGISRW